MVEIRCRISGMKLHTGAIVLLFLLGISFVASAETEAPAAGGKFTPRVATTHHKIQIGKETLAYTAIAGETVVEDNEGAQIASIFAISYIKEGTDKPSARPLTFFFNGGPGSSTVWLHLGAFGPRRVSFSSDLVNPGAPPYPLQDNPHTLLAYTDLVFVDPVGTGYSKALGKSKDKDFWGVDEDSDVLSKYIRAYLSANQRWNSPKYLGGESYGTIRSAVLIRDLEFLL